MGKISFITPEGSHPFPFEDSGLRKHISQAASEAPEVDKSGPSCILPIFLLHMYVDTMWIYIYVIMMYRFV